MREAEGKMRAGREGWSEVKINNNKNIKLIYIYN